MRRFYAAFLDWRADAGMDNEMADHLPGLFESLGFHSIESIPADETYRKGEEHFVEKAGIWSKVAASRGVQMVQGGWITEAERLNVIAEYDAWVGDEAECMVMKLTDVRGKR